MNEERAELRAIAAWLGAAQAWQRQGSRLRFEARRSRRRKGLIVAQLAIVSAVLVFFLVVARLR